MPNSNPEHITLKHTRAPTRTQPQNGHTGQTFYFVGRAVFAAILTNLNAFAVATLSARWSTIPTCFAILRTRREPQAGVNRAGALM